MFVLNARQMICCSHSEGEGPLHGHNWHVCARVEAAELDPQGRVLPMEHLQAGLATALEPLDHRHLNDLEPFRDRAPSAERVAQHIFEVLRPLIETPRARLAEVEVVTASSASAVYRPDC